MSALVAASAEIALQQGPPVHRTVLTEAGLGALFEQGWQALARTLGTPQTWFVSEARVRADAGWRPATDEPYLVDHRQDPQGGRRLLFYVHPAVRWFEGHFPGRPILPGVAQIDLAGRMAAAYGLTGGNFCGLAGVKFTAPVEPGAMVTMLLTGGGDAVGFSLTTAGSTCCRGTLRYRDDGPQ